MSTPVAAPSAAPAASSSPAPSSSPSTPSTPSTSPSPAASTQPTPSSKGVPNAPGGDAPQGTAEAKVEAAAKAEEIKKWKLKVNNQEHEVTESEMIRRAQLGYSADEKFKKANEIKTQAEDFFRMLKTDPMAVLTHPELGLDMRNLAENFLAGELKKEMMPPEQRELEDLRAYKAEQTKAREDADKERMTQGQQQEFARAQKKAATEYDTKISEVLKAADLPKQPRTVKRVAEALKVALENGYDLDVETAVDMVREEYLADFKQMFGGLKGESLTKFLGDDALREVRQFDLARLKARLEGESLPPPTQQNTSPAIPRQNNSEPKQMRQEEWIESLRKKAGL